jgi:hypothetical protein
MKLQRVPRTGSHVSLRRWHNGCAGSTTTQGMQIRRARPEDRDALFDVCPDRWKRPTPSYPRADIQSFKPLVRLSRIERATGEFCRQAEHRGGRLLPGLRFFLVERAIRAGRNSRPYPLLHMRLAHGQSRSTMNDLKTES